MILADTFEAVYALLNFQA